MRFPGPVRVWSARDARGGLATFQMSGRLGQGTLQGDPDPSSLVEGLTKPVAVEFFQQLGHLALCLQPAEKSVIEKLDRHRCKHPLTPSLRFHLVPLSQYFPGRAGSKTIEPGPNFAESLWSDCLRISIRDLGQVLAFEV